MTICVMFPAWLWTFDPTRRMIFSSYSTEFSYRDSRKTKNLIRTAWYQSRWGDRFRILADKDTIKRFENDHGGFRYSTSTTGGATGEGGDYVVTDDPVSAQESNSDTVRESTNQWWSETMGFRKNNLLTAHRIIVMQRLHENDLSGYCLASEGYEHLCLPMEYDPLRVQLVSTPFVQTIAPDPRTEEGEILHPVRFPPDEIERLKHPTLGLGDYGFAGQCQQLPSPRGGGLLKRHWFVSETHPLVAAAPPGCVRVRYWDKASSKDKRSAYTAGVKLAYDIANQQWYVEDVRRGRWSADEREPIMRETAIADGAQVAIYIEQEPGSGGKDGVQGSIRNLAGFSAWADRATGDKTFRAEPMASQASTMSFHVVAGDWNEDFLREVESFPAGRYRDQIDALSGAFSKLVAGRPFSPPRQANGRRRSSWGPDDGTQLPRQRHLLVQAGGCAALQGPGGPSKPIRLRLASPLSGPRLQMS